MESGTDMQSSLGNNRKTRLRTQILCSVDSKQIVFKVNMVVI